MHKVMPTHIGTETTGDTALDEVVCGFCQIAQETPAGELLRRRRQSRRLPFGIQESLEVRQRQPLTAARSSSRGEMPNDIGLALV